MYVISGTQLKRDELKKRYAKGERDFRGVDLRATNLNELKLTDVNLSGAEFKWSRLEGTDFSGSNLAQTCLDPMAVPNGNVDGFELIDGGQWAVGYRTQGSPYLCVRNYEPGQLREAPVFSVSSTECHPGIYVMPTVLSVDKLCSEELGEAMPVVKVLFRPWECHKAGDKWRVRWLIVWEEI